MSQIYQISKFQVSKIAKKDIFDCQALTSHFESFWSIVDCRYILFGQCNIWDPTVFLACLILKLGLCIKKIAPQSQSTRFSQRRTHGSGEQCTYFRSSSTKQYPLMSPDLSPKTFSLPTHHTPPNRIVVSANTYLMRGGRKVRGTRLWVDLPLTHCLGRCLQYKNIQILSSPLSNFD